jgi:hypothetical protein
MPDANYNADAVLLSELLSTAALPIEVPDWQRSYSWQTDQIEVFWADLARFDRAYPGTNVENQQYFLGSIVLVMTPTKYLLLDGQQRIATATILLCVLRETRRSIMVDAATGATAALETKYIKDFDYGTSQTQYSVTLNTYDKDYFRQAIQAGGTTTYLPKLRSHGLIRQAYNYFHDQVQARTANMSPAEAMNFSIRLQDVLLKHFSVVAVKSQDEDTAATVFEALNDRGIGLSTPDLLRSYLLRAAPNGDGRNSVVESWLAVFSLFEDSGVEQFLRHYWISLHGDVKTRSLYREMKGKFERDGVDAVAFSLDLARAAADYRALKDSADPDDAVSRLLKEINQLNATVLYPALLSAVAVRDMIGPEGLRKLFRALIVLYVRHSVILGRESTKLEAEIYANALGIRANESVSDALTRVRTFAPSLLEFYRGFEVATVSRADTAKYLLAGLEMHLRSTEELRLEDNKRVQLEHIYPQTPTAGDRLSAHSGLINRIGNHTLLGHRLNASAKNAGFATKRTTTYVNSELKLTLALVASPAVAWGADEINARQKELAVLAAESWSFDADEHTEFLSNLTESPDSAAETPMSIDSLPEDVEDLLDVANE